MPYELPTTDQFYERFPIFENYDEDALTAIIAEAASQIDESWREVDYQPAIMYLAAHMIALDNSQAGEEVQIGEPGSITSESFAGMSVSYGSAPQSSGVSGTAYALTSYGRRYYLLLIKNKPGVVVA